MTGIEQPSSEGTGAACLERRFQKARFTPLEASEYLGEVHNAPVAAATLNSLRCRGGGPPFQKLGRLVFYQRVALDDWIEEKLGAPRNSTSEGTR